MRRPDCHVGRALLRAIVAVASGETAEGEKPMLVVEDVSRNDWASATFVGSQHRIALRLAGRAEAVAAAMQRLETDLPDSEIAVVGHFIAEITITPETRHESEEIVTKYLIVNALAIAD